MSLYLKKWKIQNRKQQFQIFFRSNSRESVKNQQKHTATQYHFDNKEHIIYEELDVNPKTLSTYL